MVAQYTIIPSGSATFPKGHDLQMQTNLTDARWTIQVIVDGNTAARQTASGSTAFVNGAILSYTTDHDVSFTATIDGSVPEAVNSSVTLLQMVEIDNTGSAMPGSQSSDHPARGSNRLRTDDNGARRSPADAAPCRTHPQPQPGPRDLLHLPPSQQHPLRAYSGCAAGNNYRYLPVKTPFFVRDRAIFILYRPLH